MSKPITIGYLGSKEIGRRCLEILIQKSSALNLSISYVVTGVRSIGEPSPESSVKALADSMGIAVFSESESILKMEPVDYLISVQHFDILKTKHLLKAMRLPVNLHMAPLPEYRGCNQFSFAIAERSPVFGTTLHVIDEGIDSGDILFERRFELPLDLTVKELYDKTYSESVALFEESLPRLISGDFIRIPQAELLAVRASGFHLRKEIEQLKCIDITQDKETIKRLFNATYFPPFPPPYYIENGEKISITPQWIAEHTK